MEKERSRSSHKKRAERASKSFYNSWRLIRVDCLLFTVHQNWQKAQQHQDKQCLSHLRSVTTSVMAMGKLANILSRVLLLLQVTGWLMELVQRIIPLIILSLIGEIQVGCLAWILCTSGFVYGNVGWNLSWSVCAISSVPNASVWRCGWLLFSGVVFNKVINGIIFASDAWVGILLVGRWWNCTNKKDLLQSQGRGFKNHDSHA